VAGTIQRPRAARAGRARRAHRAPRELQRHLAFRDALRTDPLLQVQYLALKRALAERFPLDRQAYTRGKGEFIESTLSRLLRLT
jgi:GrpB-like predicted nucleotidyltransferase (UPF0157 family)